MFDFYNSLFQCLFDFWIELSPSRIVAKAQGKVKNFRQETERKSNEGKLTFKSAKGCFPMEICSSKTIGGGGKFRLCHDTGSACYSSIFTKNSIAL